MKNIRLPEGDLRPKHTAYMGLVPALLKNVIGAIRFDWCPPLASMKIIRLPEGDLRPRHTAYMGLVPALYKKFSVPFALIGVPHWPLPKIYAYQRGTYALDTLPTWGSCQPY